MNLPDLTSLTTGDGFYVNSSGASKAVDYAVLRDQIRGGGAGALLGINGCPFSCFAVALENNSGTLRHQFSGMPGSLNGPNGGYYAAVNGATGTSWTNTPTGNDSTTAFAGGLKVGSANTNQIWFDTANFDLGVIKPAAICMLVYNTAGTDLIPGLNVGSININGSTRNRLYINFANATSGAAFAFNTTNIASGKAIYFGVFGFLPDYA